MYPGQTIKPKRRYRILCRRNNAYAVITTKTVEVAVTCVATLVHDSLLKVTEGQMKGRIVMDRLKEIL